MRDWLNGKLDTQQLQDINIEDLLEREVIKIHNEAIYTELKGKDIGYRRCRLHWQRTGTAIIAIPPVTDHTL